MNHHQVWLLGGFSAAGLALSSAIALPAQAGSFHYSSFESPSTFRTVGNANATQGRLQLTTAAENQSGAVWHSDKQYLSYGFETTFRFQLTQPGGAADSAGNAWGDGFAFVIQNTSDSALGGFGGAMGYAGISNSVAIEFDTWLNDAGRYVEAWNGDLNGSHISVQSQGHAKNSEFITASLGATTDVELLSEQVRTAKIRYANQNLSIFLDDLDNPIFNVATDLDDLLSLDNGSAWIGFTGSTGGSWANQEILDWSYAALEPISSNLTASQLSTSVPEPSGLLGLLSAIGFARIYRRQRGKEVSAQGE